MTFQDQPTNDMNTKSDPMQHNPTDHDQRFVWAIGAYAEAYPDMPENLGVVLWDREQGRAVVTVAPEYAQLICLQRTSAEAAPFDNLETWMNGLSPEDMASEGIS
jgi:hypothetical protein